MKKISIATIFLYFSSLTFVLSAEGHSHELPGFLHFMEEIIEEHSILRGATFGFIHTLIPLIGFYTGWSINRFLKILSNGAIAGIVGIVLAHIVRAIYPLFSDNYTCILSFLKMYFLLILNYRIWLLCLMNMWIRTKLLIV